MTSYFLLFNLVAVLCTTFAHPAANDLKAKFAEDNVSRIVAINLNYHSFYLVIKRALFSNIFKTPKEPNRDNKMFLYRHSISILGKRLQKFKAPFGIRV